MGIVYSLTKGNTCYIGSTRTSVCDRVSAHVALAKRWRVGKTQWCSAYDLVEGGRGTFEAHELESLPNCTITALRRAEQKHYQDACANPEVRVLNRHHPCKDNVSDLPLNRQSCATKVLCPHCTMVTSRCNMYKHVRQQRGSNISFKKRRVENGPNEAVGLSHETGFEGE